MAADQEHAPETRDRTAYGQRVRTARKHRGLTQEKLAEATGLGQSAIAYLESKAHGSEQTWLIAQVCGVRSAWLARGEGPMVGPESDLEVAAHRAEEVMPAYLQEPNTARDYRTVAHTLAKSLRESGVSLSVEQFLALADEMYRRFGRG